MSYDSVLIDAIRYLGNIAKNILSSENGDLIIPASNTTISGDLTINGMVNGKVSMNSDLIVNGKLTLNNDMNKIILINMYGYHGYGNGPILDNNGFSIPSDKYYYRINTEEILLLINDTTKEWWCIQNPKMESLPRVEVIRIEFILRDNYYSNTIFNDTKSTFTNPDGSAMDSYGFYLRLIDESYNKVTSDSQNKTAPNPYK